ncbi:hypothetical protein [Trujillonella humicola]|uniref:hypothetical protein n=1 Tax=Trujillonella humicola TaxID=3383699 RepID=UPI0039067CF3
MKLVELRGQAGDGREHVLAAVRPLEAAAADDYAAQLRHLVRDISDLRLAVGTAPVLSVSGETAAPPPAPADTLPAALARAGRAVPDDRHAAEPDPGS